MAGAEEVAQASFLTDYFVDSVAVDLADIGETMSIQISLQKEVGKLGPNEANIHFCKVSNIKFMLACAWLTCSTISAGLLICP